MGFWNYQRVIFTEPTRMHTLCIVSLLPHAHKAPPLGEEKIAKIPANESVSYLRQ